MNSAAQVSDPSDWPVGFVKVAELDSHLRCPICREFLRGAVMLNCHHTFCSACLRRHLDKESTCPACRVSANTAQIRRNVVLEEVTNCFVDCRELLLKTVQDSIRRAQEDQERLFMQSAKNSRRDQQDDEHDMDNFGGDDGDDDGDYYDGNGVAGQGGKRSTSSSQRSTSTPSNKRPRVSTRRRAAENHPTQSDANSQEFMDCDLPASDDGLSQQHSPSAAAAARSSQRARRTRNSSHVVDDQDDFEDDFQPEYQDRAKPPVRKRVTRQSQALDQQQQQQQDLQNSHQPTRSSARTRSAAKSPTTDPPSTSSTPTPTPVPAPAAPQPPTISPEAFGIVACPVCGCGILHDSVNQHLDLCTEGKKDPKYNVQYEQLQTMDPEAMQHYAKHGTGTPPSSSTLSMMNLMAPSPPGKKGARGAAGSVRGGGGVSSGRTSMTSNNTSLASSGTSLLYREGNGYGGAGTATSWSLPAGMAAPSSNALTTNGAVTVYPERRPLLPKLAYGVLTEKQLRKKLQELGLATHGDKALMQKRHAEYLTRYNANCDALRPFSDRELKRQMVEWEQAYGMDQQAREQQRRAQEALQRQVQEEQQLRLSQEMTAAASSSSQGSLSQEATGQSFGQGAPLTNNNSNTNTATATATAAGTTAPAFIPNHANNTNAAVAIAEAASFAHAARYADEYEELIASVRRRILQSLEKAKEKEKEKEQEQENEAAKATANVEG
ncbi:E3 ubiquitin-protein ligase rad18 [Actinomortierella ambigua]|nr:E3 ubiquitin-protein ligase rad18 [Actinomortierella ambigua]